MMIRLCVITALALATVGSVRADATETESGHDDAGALNSAVVNEVLQLKASTLVQLDLPNAPAASLTVVIPIDGQEYTLQLTPHSVRSANYQLKMQLADGTLVNVEPGISRTMRGVVAEIPGSMVAGSLLERGLQAKIVFNAGEVYWIEPLAGRVSGASSDYHVIYRSDDIQPHDGECGLAAEADRKAESIPMGARGGACGATHCVAELGLDADFEYFQAHGSSVSQTESDMEAVINTVNMQYQYDVAIVHEITGTIVRSSEPDPYTSTDFSVLLNQFRNEWLANQGGIQRDVAHLFTGKNLNGGVIGVAFIIGGICTNEAFCLSQSDFNGNFGCATDLSAHELGHLWNGSHCGCTSHTMNSFITCANVFNPTQTVPDITGHRDSRSCLDGIIINDGTPPTPDPMTFDAPPSGVAADIAFMRATLADDASSVVEYKFDFVSGAAGGTDSFWQDSQIYFDSGLTPNSDFTYRVQARDGGGNETEFSDNETAITYIETPAGSLQFVNVTSSTIDIVAVDTFTNLNLAMSGLFFDSTSAAGGDEGINEWIQIPTDTATGLFPDLLYTFTVKARNQDGIETEFGSSTSVATLANVPGAPLLSDADCDSLTIEIDPNGNVSLTKFAVQCTDTSPHDATWDGKFVDANSDPTDSAVYRANLTWGTIALTGLESVTTYTFVVTAQNQEDMITDPGPEASLATLSCGDCEGDVNGDSTVDPLDTGFVLARFGCSVGTGNPDCDVADVNVDGVVDPLDVGFILARFGGCP